MGTRPEPVDLVLTDGQDKAVLDDEEEPDDGDGERQKQVVDPVEKMTVAKCHANDLMR